MSVHLPPAILAQVEHGLLNKYFIMVAEAILVYDYLLMLPAEIQHIWMAKWGVGSTLYFLIRYIAFAESPFLLLFAFNTGFGKSAHAKTLCVLTYKSAAWLDYSGMIVATNVLFLRTAAIWGWTRKALGCVVLGNLIITTLAGYTLGTTLNSMRYVPSPFPKMFPCYATFENNKAFIDFAAVMCVEICVVALTVYRRCRYWPKNPTTLLRSLYRDSILFFSCLVVVTAANLIIYATPSLNRDFFQLLVQLQFVLSSVLTTRIILHLRIESNRAEYYTASAIMDNDGANRKALRSNTFGSYPCAMESEMELHPRGSGSLTIIRHERKPSHSAVVNPYMI